MKIIVIDKFEGEIIAILEDVQKVFDDGSILFRNGDMYFNYFNPHDETYEIVG